MKVSSFFVLMLVLGLAVSASAALVDNGNGTITDTDRGLMYYDYSYRVNVWSDAMTWIDTLNNDNTLGYNDWKLPSALNSDGSGPCSDPAQCSDSDLGHLYYIEGVSFTDPGPFKNILAEENGNSWYWTETVYDEDPSRSWIFTLNSGKQHTHDSPYLPEGFAMAVRVVPEPISSILFVTGGATLGLRRFLKKRTA
jgi:hypothetical protein